MSQKLRHRRGVTVRSTLPAAGYRRPPRQFPPLPYDSPKFLLQYCAEIKRVASFQNQTARPARRGADQRMPVSWNESLQTAEAHDIADGSYALSDLSATRRVFSGTPSSSENAAPHATKHPRNDTVRFHRRALAAPSIIIDESLNHRGCNLKANPSDLFEDGVLNILILKVARLDCFRFAAHVSSSFRCSSSGDASNFVQVKTLCMIELTDSRSD